MKADRNGKQAQQARVDLTRALFKAQDADDEATVTLAQLLILPAPANVKPKKPRR